MTSAFIYAITKDTCVDVSWKMLFIYIPTFKQNIFSVEVATKNGVHISLERDNSQLIYLNEAVFNITERTFVLSEKYCFCQKCHL